MYGASLCYKGTRLRTGGGESFAIIGSSARDRMRGRIT